MGKIGLKGQGHCHVWRLKQKSQQLFYVHKCLKYRQKNTRTNITLYWLTKLLCEDYVKNNGTEGVVLVIAQMVSFLKMR